MYREVVDMELIVEADIDDVVPNVPILNENDEKDIHEVLSIIKGQSKILYGSMTCSYLVHLWTEKANRKSNSTIFFSILYLSFL